MRCRALPHQVHPNSLKSAKVITGVDKQPVHLGQQCYSPAEDHMEPESHRLGIRKMDATNEVLLRHVVRLPGGNTQMTGHAGSI